MQTIQFVSSVMLALVFLSFFDFSLIDKATASAVVTYVIEASKDDAWSKTDDVKWDTDECYLATADIISGYRCRINISREATILSANFVCRARNNISGKNTTVRIEAFDQDSCTDFDENFWNWEVTTEYVDWRLPDPFLPNAWYTSPDLKAIIQAFVNRTGYNVGSYLGLRIKLQSGDSAGHEVSSWDFNPAFAAKLEVAYILPEPPAASFSYTPENPSVNESITFDASASHDPDGTVVDFAWNFGDGNTTATTSKVISHVYAENGSYNVTLTAVDNDGYNNTTFHIISVNTHDIAILNVTVSNNKVDIGQVVNITVTVKNKGTASESFNITIFCNSTSLETLVVSNLAPNGERTLVFQWNTSNIGQPANFSIRAEADVVVGENDVADNTYIDGIIEVSQILNRRNSLLDWKRMLLLLIPLGILLFVGIMRKKKNANQNFRDFNFFDEITDGGIPDSFSVLVTGNPGSGKSMFCQQLTHKFLNAGKSCVYLTYDCFPSEVRENMKKFNWDTSKYEQEGKFAFIDCFSSIAQVATRERYSVNQPFSLSDLGIMMSKATSGEVSAPKVFFDSVMPLLTHVDQSKVVEFLQDRSARIKGVNGTFIFAVGKEAIEPNLLSRLEEVVDCVVEMDVDKTQGKTIQKLRIKKMRGRKASDKWIMFDVNPTNGIIFRV